MNYPYYTYGYAMKFNKGYEKQKNIIHQSAYQTFPSTIFHSDGRYVSDEPFYHLGPQYLNPPNCPFYNYTLPDTYPDIPTPQINPRAYWFLPYNKFDWSSYNSQSLSNIHKN